MLQACEQIVIFMDEFDELVRDREAPGEMESRFLTTAMLPKLAQLSERRRVVYLLATNHLERFDTAIGRPGRFDTILLVMPPTYEAKVAAWPTLAERIDAAVKLGQSEEELKRMLEDLTYAETENLVNRLERLSDGPEAAASVAEIINDEHRRATLSLVVGDQPSDATPDKSETWKQRIASQSSRIRLPAS